MSSCLNCGEDAVTTWAGVSVCKDCSTIADVIFRRNQQQLSALLVLLKDSIRAKLVQGKLRPGLEVGDEVCSGPPNSHVQAEMSALQSGSGVGEQQEPGPGDNH